MGIGAKTSQIPDINDPEWFKWMQRWGRIYRQVVEFYWNDPKIQKKRREPPLSCDYCHRRIHGLPAIDFFFEPKICADWSDSKIQKTYMRELAHRQRYEAYHQHRCAQKAAVAQREREKAVVLRCHYCHKPIRRIPTVEIVKKDQRKAAQYKLHEVLPDFLYQYLRTHHWSDECWNNMGKVLLYYHKRCFDRVKRTRSET